MPLVVNGPLKGVNSYQEIVLRSVRLWRTYLKLPS